MDQHVKSSALNQCFFGLNQSHVTSAFPALISGLYGVDLGPAIYLVSILTASGILKDHHYEKGWLIPIILGLPCQNSVTQGSIDRGGQRLIRYGFMMKLRIAFHSTVITVMTGKSKEHPFQFSGFRMDCIAE